MKNKSFLLLFGLLLTFSLSYSQTTPSGLPRGGNGNTMLDSYLSITKRLGIPTANSDVLDGLTSGPNSAKILYNTTLGKLRIYNPITKDWKDAIEVDLLNYYSKAQVDSLLVNTPKVNSFNTRTGDVTLIPVDVGVTDQGSTKYLVSTGGGKFTGGIGYVNNSSQGNSIAQRTATGQIIAADGVKDAEVVNVRQLNTKQNILVSGSNLKTINGESLLGSENIVITAESPDLQGVLDKGATAKLSNGKQLLLESENSEFGFGLTDNLVSFYQNGLNGTDQIKLTGSGIDLMSANKEGTVVKTVSLNDSKGLHASSYKISDGLSDESFTPKLYVDTETAKKQDKLESGVNLKTVNGESLLGSENIEISVGAKTLQEVLNNNPQAKLTDDKVFFIASKNNENVILINDGQAGFFKQTDSGVNHSLTSQNNGIVFRSAAEDPRDDKYVVFDQLRGLHISGYDSSKEDELLEQTLVPRMYVDEYLNKKQDELVSGTNIKTINNTSIVGNGNINIPVAPSISDLNSRYINQRNFANSETENIIILSTDIYNYSGKVTYSVADIPDEFSIYATPEYPSYNSHGTRTLDLIGFTKDVSCKFMHNGGVNDQESMTLYDIDMSVVGVIPYGGTGVDYIFKKGHYKIIQLGYNIYIIK